MTRRGYCLHTAPGISRLRYTFLHNYHPANLLSLQCTYLSIYIQFKENELYGEEGVLPPYCSSDSQAVGLFYIYIIPPTCSLQCIYLSIYIQFKENELYDEEGVLSPYGSSGTYLHIYHSANILSIYCIYLYIYIQPILCHYVTAQVTQRGRFTLTMAIFRPILQSVLFFKSFLMLFVKYICR